MKKKKKVFPYNIRGGGLVCVTQQHIPISAFTDTQTKLINNKEGFRSVLRNKTRNQFQSVWQE